MVRVLYFAAARDLAACKFESLTLRDEASIKELSAELLRLHPALKKLEHSFRYSVNLDLVDDGVVLHEADEVGILPPVAGG